MRTRVLMVACVALVVMVAGSVMAQDDPITKAMEACKPEIEAYCSQVTPGEGRMVACFYAHGDKLSGRCEFALYEAANALEQFVAAVEHLATECHDDLMKYCADVQMGEGRVANCLLDHEADVTAACKQAIKDVDLKRDE